MSLLATSPDIVARNLISARAMQATAISLIACFLAQFIKFVIFSIRDKTPKWRLLISTGGFPSSHCALVVCLCTTLGMFQYHDFESVDWSFAVALVFSFVIIHDSMGVRLEASKHAKILNNLAEGMSNEEKRELGYGKKGQLKEMLGHKGIEVLGGIALGFLVGFLGFWLFAFWI